MIPLSSRLGEIPASVAGISSKRDDKFPFNKSRKSLVGKIWEAESAVPGGEGPQKSWGNKIRVRVRAPAVMDLESHVLAGLPHT